MTAGHGGNGRNAPAVATRISKCDMDTRTETFEPGICACLGFTLSILSVLVLWFNRPLFAVLYTFGNITGLIGTGFLIGFAAQCKVHSHTERFYNVETHSLQPKKMFDASRVWATSIFLISMILTLTVAFTIASVPLYVAFVLAGLK